MIKISYDKSMTKIEIFKFLLRNVLMLIRGNIRFIFKKKKSHKIIVGKKVIIRNKRRIHFEGSIRIGDYAEIDGLSKNGIHFGRNVSIGKYSIMRGSNWIDNLGRGIKIGDNFGCGDFCFFGAGGGIEIGNDVMMGQNVRFHAQNHNYNEEDLIRLQGVNSKGIKIGNNCWIGAGVVFLDGVTIGDGCVIGANTVVTKSFEDNCVIVGNPGKILKKRIKN